MSNDTLIALAKERAAAAGVDPALACAVCDQESSWNPWAIRCEPGFYMRYVAKLHLGPTEAWARAFSWGLLQLMGETAREEGYLGDMAMLCDPQTGLDRGLIHLKKQLERANGDNHAALQFWNGGSAPNYAAEVLARVGKYL
jgi:soluble lytic murein transglycosylase-like protein